MTENIVCVEPTVKEYSNIMSSNGVEEPNIHILIVDDRENMRNLLSQAFQEMGYQVSMASTGERSNRPNNSQILPYCYYRLEYARKIGNGCSPIC